MFDIGKTYWITFKGEIKDKVLMKAKLLDENAQFLKIEAELTGKIFFLNQKDIISINEDRGVKNE